MKRHESLFLLLGAVAPGLLLCRPSLGQDAITLSPSVSLPSPDAGLAALEEAMLFFQRPA